MKTFLNPKNLQFTADKRLGGELWYEGHKLCHVGIQRVKRFGRGNQGKIQNNIFYSEYHNAIVYDYWPGARFMMLIAPRHKQQKYLRIFKYGVLNRKDKIWLWLHKYEMIK